MEKSLQRYVRRIVQRECKRCGIRFYSVARHEPYCSLECRFWSWVDKREPDACWPWRGSMHERGYGSFTVGVTVYRSSRCAYEMSGRGAIPRFKHVLHKCDNRRCCNPRHLFIGTHADNMSDKVAKGRASRANAKLTEAQAMAVFLEEGSYPKIAKKFGISRSTVGNIKRRERWQKVLANL